MLKTVISYKILLKTSSKILALDSQIYHDYSIPGTKPGLLRSSKIENFPTIVDGYSRQLLFQSFPCEMSEVVLATPPHATYILNCTVVYTAKLTVSCHTKSLVPAISYSCIPWICSGALIEQLAKSPTCEIFFENVSKFFDQLAAC